MVAALCGTIWIGLLALMAQYPGTLGLFSGPPCCLPPLCVLGLGGPSWVRVGADRHCRHHLACTSEAFTPRSWCHSSLVWYGSSSDWAGVTLPQREPCMERVGPTHYLDIMGWPPLPVAEPLQNG